LVADLFFRLSTLDWLGILDLFLVTLLFFVILLLLQRSRAANLLRGVLLLGLILAVIAVFLPLPTFDWVIRLALLIMLIATPIVLQPELRRLLENIGRWAGLTRTARQSTAETVIPKLSRALETLAATKTGALIVLEGDTPLDDVIATGIPVNGRVTSELLLTIFHDKTPLHDGAVIIRGDQVVAAGCVLPLTEKAMNGRGRRYGTRHRAAMGMSEQSDALILIVSEETGHISYTRDGRLHSNVDLQTARQQIADFYTGEANEPNILTFSGIIHNLKKSYRQSKQTITGPDWKHTLFTLFVALVLALTAWAFVIQQTNPTERPVYEGVALRLENLPDNLVIMNNPPETISVQAQTTAQMLPSLDSDSFQAVASLADLPPGLQQVEVLVSTNLPQVEIMRVEPAVISVELAENISKMFPVTVVLQDQTVSAAYQIVGAPIASPDTAVVSGPKPLVDQVSVVQATLSVNNPTTSIQEIRPLLALDAEGNQVEGVTVDPNQTQISLAVTRKQNARDVGIRAITTGTPPEGYWLSGLSVEPSVVTIQGDTAVLNEIGSYVDTLPVDISQATGQLTVDVPLAIPAEVEVITAEGEPVKTVTVVAQVTTRSGDLSLTREVELFNASEGITVTIQPETIDLLLSGPLPTLQEIETHPELVRVSIDTASLTEAGQFEIEPKITAPDGLKVQLAPATVTVTVITPPEPEEPDSGNQ
ncbi:MAG TPA: TIGR00159 family protein, partial [Chloroflexi bacterium]|nr:TIGR00159 family protein [Chloroflexota bacterium]